MLLALASLSCAGERSRPGISAEEAPKVAGTPAVACEAVDRSPIIVSLALRDRTLRVTAGGGSPRFVVARSDGTLLSESLVDTELANRFPELWDAYQNANAKHGPYLDATLAPRAPGPEPDAKGPLGR